MCQLVDVAVLHVQFEAVGLRLTEVEQLVDQSEKSVDVLAHNVKVIVDFLVLNMSVDDVGQRPFDERDWSAYLMCYTCEEVDFAPVQLLLGLIFEFADGYVAVYFRPLRKI